MWRALHGMVKEPIQTRPYNDGTVSVESAPRPRRAQRTQCGAVDSASESAQLQVALRRLMAASRELAKAGGDIYGGAPLVKQWLFDDSARICAGRAARRLRAARRCGCSVVRKEVSTRTVRELDSGALRIADLVRCAQIVEDAIELLVELDRTRSAVALRARQNRVAV